MSQQNLELIDDTFTVVEQKYGLWKSFDIQGNPLLTALTRDHLIQVTRWMLKSKQDGTWETQTTSVHEGTVGGKL